MRYEQIRTNFPSVIRVSKEEHEIRLKSISENIHEHTKKSLLAFNNNEPTLTQATDNPKHRTCVVFVYLKLLAMPLRPS